MKIKTFLGTKEYAAENPSSSQISKNKFQEKDKINLLKK
jgi:hypothetical protein